MQEEEHVWGSEARGPYYLLGLVIVLMILAQGLSGIGLGLNLIAGLKNDILTNCLLNSAFMGAFVVYWFLPLRRLEALFVVLGALLLEGMLWRYRSQFFGPFGCILELGSGASAAVFPAYLWRIYRTSGPHRRQVLAVFITAYLNPLYLMLAAWGNAVISRGNPWVFDLYGYAIDNLWGGSIAFHVAHFVQEHALLRWLVWLTYFNLPVALIVVQVLCLRHPSKTFSNAQGAFILMGALGGLLYSVYPMVDHAVLFGQRFPQLPAPEPPPVRMIEAPLEHPRSCMPSLHTAWALGVLFSCAGLGRRAAVLGTLFVIVTLLGTLRVGHYVIDLVVGFPFALFVHTLTVRPRPGNAGPRALALSVGALLVMVSLVTLRYASPWLIAHPWVTLPAQVVIVVVSLVLERRVRLASMPSEPAPD